MYGVLITALPYATTTNYVDVVEDSAAVHAVVSYRQGFGIRVVFHGA